MDGKDRLCYYALQLLCPVVMRRGAWMVNIKVGLLLASLALSSVIVPSALSKEALPVEPDTNLRVDELYDHEARLFIILYSLKGDGKVDYITGRSVLEYTRSNYGNPVYYTENYPLFYWWNHVMWNDPFLDGVNGNERVYQENIEFDVTRYKPCVFNGQLC